jgi:HSP20 family protein
MASFFEKLKKGMGAEVSETEISEIEPSEESIKKPAEKEKLKKGRRKPKTSVKKKTAVSLSAQDKSKETEEKPAPEKEAEKEETEQESKTSAEKWSAFSGEPEGQLAIDLYQTEDEIVVRSAIAGIKPEDLDISIEGDMVAIRGIREKPNEDEEKSYLYQECYWGPFSRELILSEEIDSARATAEMKEGILTIRIPRIQRQKKRKISVRA